MGGVVAWEIARQLRDAGQEVGLLALVETWPPDEVASNDQPSVRRAPALLEFLASRLRLHRESISKLRGRARWQYVLERMRPLADRPWA